MTALLSNRIRYQKRQIDSQSNVILRSDSAQTKLKANCLIALLDTTAAAGEAAKLHKFIRQIVFQI